MVFFLSLSLVLSFILFIQSLSQNIQTSDGIHSQHKQMNILQTIVSDSFFYKKKSFVLDKSGRLNHLMTLTKPKLSTPFRHQTVVPFKSYRHKLFTNHRQDERYHQHTLHSSAVILQTVLIIIAHFQWVIE